MSEIIDIIYRKILDSRGNATLEVDVVTADGFGRAAAPSGASTGAHEVAPWPKGGVDQAIELAEDLIVPELEGVDCTLQRDIDELLTQIDGTPNFSNIGGNTAVATSLAVARAAASGLGMPLYAYLGGTFISRLPRPLGNVLGGGAHAVGGTDIQEYMSVSFGPSVQESVFANAWVSQRMKAVLKEKFPGQSLGKGDEGAWTAPVTNEEGLQLVSDVCAEATKEFGFDVRVSLDVAATEFYKNGKYVLKDGTSRTTEEQVAWMADLAERYNLFSLEDPLAEDDWEGWTALTERIGEKVVIIGDDLFTTNPERLIEGINRKAANAILIKPNQIGTLSRTVDTIQLAQEHGLVCVISHRSGETTDDTIAHIGAAFGCVGIKTGAVGGERIAKLNELIRIEEEL